VKGGGRPPVPRAARRWSAARPIGRPGLITAYAPIGKKMIHGVESDGMLASAAELGINKDHAGIVELTGEPGAPAGPLPPRQHH